MATSCVGTTGRQIRAKAEKTEQTRTESTIPEPDCAESLPTNAQVSQLLMVMVPSPQDAADLLAAGKVGGFGLKGRQPADVGSAVVEATKDTPIPPFVASDEEGGTTQRLAAALGTLPSAAEMAEGTATDAAQDMGAYAAKMKEIGFNMVFGPVADVGTGSGLGTRSFGDDADTVASYVSAIVGAIQDAGVIAVVKHWPGIGGGTADPHDSLAALDDINDLRSTDMIPFRAAIAADVGGIMVSHSVVPGLTADDEPASLSKEAISGELRGGLDYGGLVITDSLGMGAVVATTPQDEAAEMAISAGADVALMSGTDATTKAHARLTDAIRNGRIPEAQVERSVRRVLAAKGISGPCPDIVAATTMSADTSTDGTSSEDDTDQTSDESVSDRTDTEQGAPVVTDRSPTAGDDTRSSVGGLRSGWRRY